MLNIQKKILLISLLVSFVSPSWAHNKVVVIPLGGDDIETKRLENIIVVSEIDGDFTDPIDAIFSIPTDGETAPSETNQYTIIIAPGIYTLSQVLPLRQFVNVIGSGEDNTKLTGALGGDGIDAGASVIKGANNTIISNLTIENIETADVDDCAGLYLDATIDNTFKAKNITVNVKCPGLVNGVFNSGNPELLGLIVSAETTSNSSNAYGVRNNGDPLIRGVTTSGIGGFSTAGFYNSSGGNPTLIDVTTNGLNGTQSRGFYSTSGQPVLKKVHATGSGGSDNNYGLSLSDSDADIDSVIAVAMGIGTSVNFGVVCSSCNPTLKFVDATASGGSQSYGVSAGSFCNVPITFSKLEGGTNGLRSQTSFSDIDVSHSSILGGVSGAGTLTCSFSDDGVGGSLDSSCQ